MNDAHAPCRPEAAHCSGTRVPTQAQAPLPRRSNLRPRRRERITCTPSTFVRCCQLCQLVSMCQPVSTCASLCRSIVSCVNLCQFVSTFIPPHKRSHWCAASLCQPVVNTEKESLVCCQSVSTFMPPHKRNHWCCQSVSTCCQHRVTFKRCGAYYIYYLL